MENFYTNSRVTASFLPCLVKSFEPVIAVKIQENIREDFFCRFAFLPLLVEDFFKLIIKVNCPGIIIFGFVRFSANDSEMRRNRVLLSCGRWALGEVLLQSSCRVLKVVS